MTVARLMNALVLGLLALPVWAFGEPRYTDPPAPHEVTYNKRSAAPGDIVTINGRQFVTQRIPITDFDGGRYALTYLGTDIYAPQPPSGPFLYVEVVYYHSVAPLSPNITIDGYPARFEVFEQYQPSLIRHGSTLPWFFSTPRMTRTYLTVSIGNARVVYLFDAYVSNFEEDEVGAVPNAVPSARWWRLDENPEYMRTLDWLIDYIRIYKFP